MRRTSFVPFVALLLIAFSSPAGAQQAPPDGHGGSAGAGASGGGSGQRIPLALPPARGGIPVPLSIVHDGGTRAGELGVGWSIPFSYVERPNTLAHTRPKFFSNPDAAPEPLDRVYLVLGGSRMLMVPVGGDRYRPMVGAQGMELIQEDAASWRLNDGSGRVFRFQHNFSLGETEGFWPLMEVNDPTGLNPVKLIYDIQHVAVGSANVNELSLIALEYNQMPGGGCAKHRIDLYYGPAAATPYAVGVSAGKLRARNRIVTGLDIKANGDTCASRRRLIGYRFAYLPDADTGLPRLNKVDIVGREGTAEANASIPVARYAYGSMTGTALSYHHSQLLSTPAGGPVSMKHGLGKSIDTTGQYDAVQSFSAVHAIADLNGDGRADMVYAPGVAEGTWPPVQVAFGQATSATAESAPRTEFGPLTATGLPGALSRREVSGRRYGYGDTITTDDSYVQLIDMNGDGRVDLLESRFRDYWTLHLNTPNGSNGITWSERRIDTTAIRQDLIERKLLPFGFNEKIPLSRSVTGWSITYRFCYVVGTRGLCPVNSVITQDWLWQRTVTMWNLTDMNGDGYPDFVSNELPVARVRSGGDCVDQKPPGLEAAHLDPWVDPNSELTCKEQYSLELTEDPYPSGLTLDDLVAQPTTRSSGFVVHYNKAGHQLAEHTRPFSLATTISGGGSCGISSWESNREYIAAPLLWEHFDPDLDGTGWTSGAYELVLPDFVFDRSEQYCALIDVNGDGLVDRVAGRDATLGTGAGFRGEIELPTLSGSVVNGRYEACSAEDGEPTPPDDTAYFVSTTSGLMDLTADGIPDVVADGKIWVGTGAGWAEPKQITVAGAEFTLSTTQETCGGGAGSIVKSGVYDFDGDGRLEFVRMTDDGIEVQRIAAENGTRIGVPDAGRMIGVSNGYGATTIFTYTSAKNDQVGGHDVPFSEIVLSTTYATAPEGDLAPTRYAYRGIEMRFDAAADRWVSTGYARQVVLRGVAAGGDTQGARVKGVAQISDHRRATPGGGSFEDYLLTGAPEIVHSLDGDFTTDPWALLAFENTSASGLLHGQAIMTYQAERRSSTSYDCLEMGDFYAPVAVLSEIDGRYDRPCTTAAYAYPKTTQRWQGEAISGPAVWTAQIMQEVDDVGRPLRIWNRGDLYDGDDDTCQDITYASAGPHGIYDAVHEVTVTNCKGSPTATLLSRMRMAYDGHADVQAGSFAQVTLGRPTTITSYGYETQLGSEQSRLVETIDYDDFGNIRERVVSDGTDFRTSTYSNADPFRMAFRDATISATDVAVTFPASTTFDPFSLAPLTATDPHGTTSVSAYDGFGRATSSSVIPAGSATPVPISTQSYLGFQPDGSRRVVRTDYMTEGSGDPRNSTTFIDSLGRIKYVESSLGADYGDSIVSGSVIYDTLGRVVFARDAYAQSSSGAIYGTTYHYRADGTLDCSVRGPGLMPLIRESDESQDIYPTCYQRAYQNNHLAVRVQGPNELLPGSPQYGAYDEDLVTATGRVFERARWVGTERRELVRFTYDPLGSITRMSRFANPATAGGKLDWAFSRDSAGRALVMSEPSAPPRFMEYDHWGNLEGTTWDEPTGERRLQYAYDSLGRVTSELELRNSQEVPGSKLVYRYDEASADPDRAFRLGRLSSAESYTANNALAMKVEYGYDALGRTRAVSRTDQDFQPYHERYDYRLDGQLEHVTFRLPDAGYAEEIASYDYDSAGRLAGVTWGPGGQQVFTANDIDPFGRYRHVSYGNGVEERREYNPINRRELTSTYLRTAAGDELATSYTSYTPDLRVRERIDTKLPAVGSPELERTTYDYDGLHQMTRATTRHAGGGVIRQTQYAYDALGNMRAVDDVTGPNDSNITYRSDDPDRVCRVEPSIGGGSSPPGPVTPPGGQTQPPSGVRVWLEAEAGETVGPMVPAQDASASSGAYIAAPNGAGNNTGGVVLNFTVPKAGNYVVWGKLIGPDSGSDSFYVRMDTGSKLTWATGRPQSWTWVRMKHSTGPNPQVFALSAGSHTLTIGNREDGTRLDRVFITDQLSLSPATVEGTAVPREVSVEAENGIVEAPFALSLDSGASAGAFMSVPNGQPNNWATNAGGTITYDLDVPENGYYSVWMRVRTPNPQSDSLFLSIDPPADPRKQTWWAWHMGTSTSWTTRKAHHWNGAQHVPITVWLEAGEHTLVVRAREAGAEIDQIMLATYVATAPATPPAAPPDNCQYRYDPSGNVIALDTSAEPARAFGYDGRGRVTSMVSGPALGKYRYGPEGDVIAFDLSGTGVATDRTERHFGPNVTRAYFTEPDPDDPTTGTSSEQLTERRIPGLPIAIRGHGADAALVYAHGEAAGVRRTTTALGALAQEKTYDPYGGIVEDTGLPSGLSSAPAGFNGGDHLPSFGIVHIGARIYDPRTGRFLQRDPLIIPRTAGMMNPYAFAWNDPINFGDPSGLDPCRADFCITNTGSDPGNPAAPLAGLIGWGIYQGALFLHDFWRGSPQAPSGGPHVVIPDQVIEMNGVAPGGTGEMQQLIDVTYGHDPEVRDYLMSSWQSGHDQWWDNYARNERRRQIAAFLRPVNAAGRVVGGMHTAMLISVAASQFLMSGAYMAFGDLVVVEGAGVGAQAVGATSAATAAGLGARASASSSTAGARLGAAAGRAETKAARAAGCPACPCFVPGTLVLMADGSTKAIEDVQVGDWVLALDPETGDNEARAYRVIAALENFTKRTIRIEVGSPEAPGVIEATGEHPFWTVDDGWVAADGLQAGDRLLDPYGSMVDVIDVSVEAGESQTYNLTIDGVQTYYVVAADHAVLVHNQSMEAAIRLQAPIAIPETAVFHRAKITGSTGAWNFSWRWEAAGQRYTARFHSPSPGAIAAGDRRNVWIIQRGTGWGNPQQALSANGQWVSYGQHATGQTGKATHLSSARGTKIIPCP